MNDRFTPRGRAGWPSLGRTHLIVPVGDGMGLVKSIASVCSGMLTLSGAILMLKPPGDRSCC